MINVLWIMGALWIGACIGYFFGALMRASDNEQKGK